METKKRLIDANPFEVVAFSGDVSIDFVEGARYILEAIDAAPTVDAVEVVRCKDCKHWVKADNGSWQMIGRTDGVCKRLLDLHYAERYMTEGEHFCSYGERREGE